MSMWSILSSVPHIWHSILSSQPLMCFQCRPTVYPSCSSIHMKKRAGLLNSFRRIEAHSCSLVTSMPHLSPAAARANTTLWFVSLLSELILIFLLGLTLCSMMRYVPLFRSGSFPGMSDLESVCSPVRLGRMHPRVGEPNRTAVQ